MKDGGSFHSYVNVYQRVSLQNNVALLRHLHFISSKGETLPRCRRMLQKLLYNLDEDIRICKKAELAGFPGGW